jgi:hypothetical protein
LGSGTAIYRGVALQGQSPALVTQDLPPAAGSVTKGFSAVAWVGVRACGFMDNPAMPDSVLTAARFPIDRLLDNRKRLPTTCQQVARCPQAPQAATISFISLIEKQKSRAERQGQSDKPFFKTLSKGDQNQSLVLSVAHRQAAGQPARTIVAAVERRMSVNLVEIGDMKAHSVDIPSP